MRRFTQILLAIATLVITTVLPFNVFAAWPERPVTIIVPYGAGGGTDATARFLAHPLQERIGQPFIVINRTGGGGIVGVTATINSKPDGYTFGIASADLSTFKWMGQTQITYRDLDPIAVYNVDCPALIVRADSPFENAKQVFEELKKNPGKYSLHVGSSVGNCYHLGFAGVAASQGVDPGKIRSVVGAGAAAGLQEVSAGGVNFSLASLSEAAALMETGKVRPILLLGQIHSQAFPKVPTAKEALGTDYEFGVWRAVMSPKGVEAGIKNTLRDNLKAVYESDKFAQLMKSVGFERRWVAGPELERYLEDSANAARDAIKMLGLAK